MTIIARNADVKNKIKYMGVGAIVPNLLVVGEGAVFYAAEVRFSTTVLSRLPSNSPTVGPPPPPQL